MAALAVVDERLSREHPLVDCNRLDDNADAPDKRVDLSARVGSNLTLDHYRQFYEAGDADSAAVSTMNQLSEPSLLGFAIKNNDESRGIKNHLGKPFSS